MLWCDLEWNHLSTCENVSLSQIYGQYSTVATWCEEIYKILRIPGDINGNSETEVNRLSIMGDSCHSCISLRRRGTGCFPNTRSSPCLMSAFPMMVLHCTPTVVSTGKYCAGNIATDCLQEDSWHPTFCSGKSFFYCCEAMYHQVSDVIPYGEACYSTCSNRFILFS